MSNVSWDGLNTSCTFNLCFAKCSSCEINFSFWLEISSALWFRISLSFDVELVMIDSVRPPIFPGTRYVAFVFDKSAWFWWSESWWNLDVNGDNFEEHFVDGFGDGFVRVFSDSSETVLVTVSETDWVTIRDGMRCEKVWVTVRLTDFLNCGREGRYDEDACRRGIGCETLWVIGGGNRWYDRDGVLSNGDFSKLAFIGSNESRYTAIRTSPLSTLNVVSTSKLLSSSNPLCTNACW